MPHAEDDYWLRFAGPSRPPAKDAWLKLENIRGVGSLDRQIGAWPKQAIPDALRDTLFGRPQSDYLMRDEEVGLRTYALLDAGKAPMVPEMLASSRVAWQSLFKGDAQDRLGSVAPYLAEVREDDGLLRRLFTDTGHRADPWRSNCTVFLRSRFNLADVARHLRKLYKVKDYASKKDIYLRFWAPETLRTLAPVLVSSQTQASRFCSNVIHSVTWRKSNDTDFTTIRLLRDLSGPAGLILDVALEQRFERAAAARRARRLQVEAEALIAKGDPVAAESMHHTPPIRRMCHARQMERLGIRSPADAAALLSIIYLTRMNILTEPAFHYATRNPFLAPQAKVRQLSLAYTMIARIQKEG